MVCHIVIKNEKWVCLHARLIMNSGLNPGNGFQFINKQCVTKIILKATFMYHQCRHPPYIYIYVYICMYHIILWKWNILISVTVITHQTATFKCYFSLMNLFTWEGEQIKDKRMLCLLHSASISQLLLLYLTIMLKWFHTVWELARASKSRI